MYLILTRYEWEIGRKNIAQNYGSEAADTSEITDFAAAFGYAILNFLDGLRHIVVNRAVCDENYISGQSNQLLLIFVVLTTAYFQVLILSNSADKTYLL